LFIVKAIVNEHVKKIYDLTPLLIPNIWYKAACKNAEKYKSYDYFKMAYKHDAEHDVAKNVTILTGFYVNTECFSL